MGITFSGGGCRVTRIRRGGIAIVTVFGAIDMLTAPFVESGITGSLDEKPAGIVVDLSHTDFLASAGIRALVHACEEAGDHGVRFAVVADSPATSRPIQLLGLQDALHLHAGTDDALATLASR